MGRTANAAVLVVALAMGTSWVSAQEKPKSEDTAIEARQTETTLLKILITFTEFEGDRKVKSLP
jgi:CHASE3 domain sensor protein